MWQRAFPRMAFVIQLNESPYVTRRDQKLILLTMQQTEANTMLNSLLKGYMYTYIYICMQITILYMYMDSLYIYICLGQKAFCQQ